MLAKLFSSLTKTTVRRQFSQMMYHGAIFKNNNDYKTLNNFDSFVQFISENKQIESNLILPIFQTLERHIEIEGQAAIRQKMVDPSIKFGPALAGIIYSYATSNNFTTNWSYS